jgi:hypothetical protein
MAKTVFLLGAGASHDANLPLMAQLTSGFAEWRERAMPQESRDSDLQLFHSAVQALTSGSADKPNIESVLSLLATVSSIKTGPASSIVMEWSVPFSQGPVGLADLRESIQRYIVESLRETRSGEAEYLLGMFEYGDGNGPIDVFTMNYDRLVESVAAQFEFRFTTGFGDYWDPGLFDLEKWEMRLFKLHGSLDWYRVPNRSLIYQGGREHYAFPGRMPSEVLLYPTEIKDAYAEPYATLMAHFTRSLSEADLCVAVGYSFRDEHIRRTVLDRMAVNPRLQLLIVDPSADSTIRLGRSRPDEPEFADFPTRIIPLAMRAKPAFENRGIQQRITQILELDDRVRSVASRRAESDFVGAGNDLLDVLELARVRHMPGKPAPLLRPQFGEEVLRGIAHAIKINANMLVQLTEISAHQRPPFPGMAARAFVSDVNSLERAFGFLVDCWMLSSVCGLAEEESILQQAIRVSVEERVSGLPILQEDAYSLWPEDPTLPHVTHETLRARATQLSNLATELRLRPPTCLLQRADINATTQFAALRDGVHALAHVLQDAADAGVSRIGDGTKYYCRIEPSILWRQLVTMPLSATIVGKGFLDLGATGILQNWLASPPVGGSRASLPVS